MTFRSASGNCRDVVDGAEQSSVCGNSDPRILGRLIPVSLRYAGVPGAMSSGRSANAPFRAAVSALSG